MYKSVFGGIYALHFYDGNWVKNFRRLKENCSASKVEQKLHSIKVQLHVSYMLTSKMTMAWRT